MRPSHDAMVYLSIIGPGRPGEARQRLGVEPSFAEEWEEEDGEPWFRWEIDSRRPITERMGDGYVDVLSLADHLEDIADQLSASWLELMRMTADEWQATLYGFQPTALVNPGFGPVKRHELMAGDWLRSRHLRLLASIDADLDFNYFSPIAHDLPKEE